VRNILLTFAITLAVSSAAANQNIEGWHDALPISAIKASAEIETKVADYTYADEGEYVGGQAWDFKLVDFYSTQDDRGEVTFKIRVQYRASMTFDYGRTETTRVCASNIHVNSELQMLVGAVECPDMPTTF
jgi:hypothetical protein